VKWAISAFTTLILSDHSELATFRAAWAAASGSISTAVTLPAPRCVAISAIRPVPVPTSSTLMPGSTGNHAPNSTPSVPTFMEHLSCSILKRLKSKYWLDIVKLQNPTAKLLFLFYSRLLTMQITYTCAQITTFAEYLQNNLCGRPRNNLKNLLTNPIRLSP